MTIDELIQNAYEHACNVLVGKPDAELIPSWLLDAPGRLIIVGTPWDGDEDKDLVAAIMRKMLKEEGVTGYSFMSEAWVTAQAVGEPYIEPRLSDKRREVVIISACTRKADCVQIYEMIRGPDAVVTELKPEPRNAEHGIFKGRLHNLFTDEA
jgi:hypothetical protein